MGDPPMTVYARPAGTSPAGPDDPSPDLRFVIPAADAERVAALPVPDRGEVSPTRDAPVLFDGQTAAVLDLVSRELVTFRRAGCGLPACGCALEFLVPGAPVPDPDVFDWWQDDYGDDPEAVP